MSPLEYELHWERVWNLLTLDALSRVQNELCIPGNLERLQLCLREELDDHYRAYELMFSAGALSVRLSTRLRSVFHEEEVLYLFAWGDYLSDLVHSRVGEFIWSSALFGLDEVDHPEWLRARFLKMQHERSSSRDEIDNALGTIKLTDRDATIVDRLNWTAGYLLTHLKLVAGYNAFDQLWHRNMNDATPGELDAVYAFGQALARKRDIMETQLCYPGIWEVGPQRTLLRLEMS
jgi:hypothetical protein